MILHFLTDDKFSEYVVKQFRYLEVASEFVLITETDEKPKFFLEYEGVQVVNPNSDSFTKIVEGLSKYKAIILHGLFWPWEEFVLRRVPKTVKVAWVFWGGEIYGRKDLQMSFLAPRTCSLMRWQALKRLVKQRRQPKNLYEFPNELFQRIDYCLTDISDEFLFASEYVNNKMKYLWYNYYSIEDTLGDAMNLTINGDNILIGNSSAVECNHLDVFSILRKVSIDRRIIVPLSYGESWIKTKIIKKGYSYFNDVFYPVTAFLPRGEYNKIISSCSVVIMNHYRPQALGNIITALWLGARVYMSEKSMQYTYFKNIELILFSIEKDLLKDLKSDVGRLSKDCIIHNRQVLMSIYGRQASMSRINELVKELDS